MLKQVMLSTPKPITASSGGFLKVATSWPDAVDAAGLPDGVLAERVGGALAGTTNLSMGYSLAINETLTGVKLKAYLEYLEVTSNASEVLIEWEASGISRRTATTLTATTSNLVTPLEIDLFSEGVNTSALLKSVVVYVTFNWAGGSGSNVIKVDAIVLEATSE